MRAVLVSIASLSKASWAFADYFEALEARSIALLTCIDEMGCRGAIRTCAAALPPVLRTPPAFIVEAILGCYE
ncbi:MAG: hypothetical protein ACI9KE_005403 [Polyangiales bacterium]|jgi:hypothetical protein